MVAHTGFEPVISALRGRCPRPLDECALYGSLEVRRVTSGWSAPWTPCEGWGWLGIVGSNHGLQIQSLPSYH